MTDDTQQSVLLTTFTSKKKRYKVFFHQGKIIWDNERPPSGTSSFHPNNLNLFEITFQRKLPFQ